MLPSCWYMYESVTRELNASGLPCLHLEAWSFTVGGVPQRNWEVSCNSSAGGQLSFNTSRLYCWDWNQSVSISTSTEGLACNTSVFVQRNKPIGEWLGAEARAPTAGPHHGQHWFCLQG